jgi:hypothetical protein
LIPTTSWARPYWPCGPWNASARYKRRAKPHPVCQTGMASCPADGVRFLFSAVRPKLLCPAADGHALFQLAFPPILRCNLQQSDPHGSAVSL